MSSPNAFFIQYMFFWKNYYYYTWLLRDLGLNSLTFIDKLHFPLSVYAPFLRLCCLTVKPFGIELVSRYIENSCLWKTNLHHNAEFLSSQTNTFFQVFPVSISIWAEFAIESVTASDQLMELLCGQEKISAMIHLVWDKSNPSFVFTGDSPKEWDLLSPMNTNDRFFFSQTSAKMDVSLELILFRGHGSGSHREVKHRKANQFWYQTVPLDPGAWVTPYILCGTDVPLD